MQTISKIILTLEAFFCISSSIKHVKYLRIYTCQFIKSNIPWFPPCSTSAGSCWSEADLPRICPSLPNSCTDGIKGVASISTEWCCFLDCKFFWACSLVKMWMGGEDLGRGGGVASPMSVGKELDLFKLAASALLGLSVNWRASTVKRRSSSWLPLP